MSERNVESPMTVMEHDQTYNLSSYASSSIYNGGSHKDSNMYEQVHQPQMHPNYRAHPTQYMPMQMHQAPAPHGGSAYGSASERTCRKACYSVLIAFVILVVLLCIALVFILGWQYLELRSDFVRYQAETDARLSVMDAKYDASKAASEQDKSPQAPPPVDNSDLERKIGELKQELNEIREVVDSLDIGNLIAEQLADHHSSDHDAVTESISSKSLESLRLSVEELSDKTTDLEASVGRVEKCSSYGPLSVYQDERCLVLFTHWLTWTDSKESCRHKGGRLAEFRHGAGFDAMQRLVQLGGAITWVGNYRSDQHWVSGQTAENVSRTLEPYWAPGEPRDIGDCVSFQSGGLTLLIARDCVQNNYYICSF